MPQGAGYFWGGLAQGLQAGVNLYTQLEDIKGRKKKRQEAEELKQRIVLESQKVADFIDDAYRDGRIDDDEWRQWNTLYVALLPEAQERFQKINELILKREYDKAKQEMEFVSSLSDEIIGSVKSGADPQTIAQSLQNYVTTKEGKIALELLLQSAAQKKAAEEREINLTAARLPYEARKTVAASEDLKQPYAEEQLEALENAVTKYSFSPKIFEKYKQRMLESGYDILSDLTYEEAQQMRKAMLKKYESPTEALQSAPELEGYSRVPYQNADGSWGIKYEPVKVVEATTTSSGEEYSASKERERDAARDLFSALIKSVGVMDITLAQPEELQAAYERFLQIKDETPPGVASWVEYYFKMHGVNVGDRPYRNTPEDKLKLLVWSGDPEAIREAQLRGYLK